MTQINLIAAGQLPLRRATPVQLTVAWFMLGIILWGVSAFVLPQFGQIFKDFKTAPPALTRAVLEVSRWCQGIYGSFGISAALMMIPFAAAFFARQTPAPADSYRKMMRVMIILLGLIMMAIVLALFLPMITLIQTTSSPK
jgi:type II secretory pathway component PulF